MITSTKWNQISDPAKYKKFSVLEKQDYNFMVIEKRLVDNILDALYEKNAITCDIKTTLTPDGPSPARSYGLQKIHKAKYNSWSSKI